MGLFKRCSALSLALGLLLSVGGMPLSAEPAHAASAAAIQADSRATLTKFKESVKGADQVLAKAKGLLIFPNVYQGGIVFGGKYGEGQLLVGGKVVDYYNIAAASWGFQLGGQKKSIIFAFMTDEALQNFRTSTGWRVGGNASVAVVAIGAEGSIDTSRLNQPVLAFVVDQKGLMYNLTLEGTKISKITK